MTATGSAETAMKPVIPLCVPCLSGNEWPYVKEALDSHWVSYVGPHVRKFEELLSAATTDGDVPRGILKGVSLEDPVRRIMNPRHTVVGLGESRAAIL
jgi:hypothetical protein